ncbi:MAG: sugar phosphate nucleotidyltransferase [Patescibacteria group bacterium]|nr:sugar phosphate nucleotidyltransferase [Patescibacteria group bacterium]MDD5566682.1 sugar phosphate nucleotidyltransferase [Patescibacteria group bacterium]
MTKIGRSRLTITLRKDLLPQLDGIIDGEKIRNRSHAIEYVLSQHLGPKIHHALILAGGQGVKMRPFTYEMPKPMIPVKGRPILQHIIKTIRDAGISDIIIVIDKQLGENIRKFFGDGSNFGVNITYIVEKERAGTAGAIRLAKDKLKEPFLLYYSDVLAEIDLPAFMEFHKNRSSVMSAALNATDKFSDYGVVKLQGNTIVNFVEKPTGNSTFGLVNAGIFLAEPELFDLLPQKTPASLEHDVLPNLAKRGQLSGYPFSGKWFDISTPDVYERVLKEWPG